MFSLRRHSNFDNIFSSRLFDQNSFYLAFTDDLKKAKSEVIIESPFITAKRKDIEFNRKRAIKYPDIQKEFFDEFMYSNPNDFNEMLELYKYYGYHYSWSLWAFQQVGFNEASKATEERLKKSKGIKK